ncbi:nitrilase-related carbon-nitrogen hydrolase [Kosmotoga pacifica]|uniref:CN hydrolase domain-containing protein n=1 Tax=Kosmotoga pacifica TaxID=1330330 RepID=A0A0G2Z586_9BACT|nr:nitrilase-related carbon-nitrogen hydrolase [Kosmotoga pacifica]AKI96722.1 hypothetical protein IX53_01550 [Kosmotoga pacifica]
MKITAASFAPEYENREVNKSKVSNIFTKAKSLGSELLIFPEMTLSGFTMNLSMYDSKDIEFFEGVADFHGVAVIFGHIVKKGKNFFNAATFYNPQTHERFTYFKRKLFSYADENRYYTKGKTPVLFSFKGLKFSILICYDLRFPELFREVKGAELFVVIASWPQSRRIHWDTLLRARAIENQAFIIGVNRTGTDVQGIEYGQLTTAFDYYGNRLKAERTGQLLSWEISEEMVAKMKHWRDVFPVLKE